MQAMAEARPGCEQPLGSACASCSRDPCTAWLRGRSGPQRASPVFRGLTRVTSHTTPAPRFVGGPVVMRQCFCAGLHDADAGRGRESAPDGHQESAEAPPCYYGLCFGSLWVAVACRARWLRAQRPTGLLAGSTHVGCVTAGDRGAVRRAAKRKPLPLHDVRPSCSSMRRVGACLGQALGAPAEPSISYTVFSAGRARRRAFQAGGHALPAAGALMMGVLAAARRMHVIKQRLSGLECPGWASRMMCRGRFACCLPLAACLAQRKAPSALFLERRACGSSLSRALAAS